MACSGAKGDYLCPGWIERRNAILRRDKYSCRGCYSHGRPNAVNVETDNNAVRLEVHHRRYGTHGSCGSCYLLGVEDDDLTTFCVRCHDAITNVRREMRYEDMTIEAHN